MLESYFHAFFTLNRLRSGPSGLYIDGYAQSLRDGGYSWWTARRYLRAAAHLGRFVEIEGTALDSVDEESLKAFRKHLRSCQCSQSNGGTTTDTFLGAKLFVAYLRSIGILKDGKCNEAPLAQSPVLESFQSWLQRHRGVAKSTLYRYSRGAADLLETMGDDPSHYDARSLRTFVLDRAQKSGTGAARSLVTALRAFLRYLAAQGKCQAGLDQAIPALAGWRLSALPRYLSTIDVQRIIEACEADSAMGSRDRAIIFLLVRLGLRAGDVAELRFPDIDWKDGSVLVSGKGRREVRLPLPQEVGDAVLNYLKCRPRVATEYIFLRVRAPIQPLHSARSVSAIVARAMRRAGVVAPSYGAHILRHTAATAMLRQGVSLYEIGAVLRHRSLDMSAHYAKIDIDLLRQVAQPWPEVSGC